MNVPDRGRGVRASDAEREQVAKLLEKAAAEGRLSPDEAGERLAAASTATYRDELGRLVADLPAPPGPEFGGYMPPPPRMWWAWGAMRFAFVTIAALALWSFWGIRFFFWPLGFMALAFFLGPWRRRRWRRWQRWGRWQRAELRGPYRF